MRKLSGKKNDMRHGPRSSGRISAGRCTQCRRSLFWARFFAYFAGISVELIMWYVGFYFLNRVCKHFNPGPYNWIDMATALGAQSVVSTVARKCNYFALGVYAIWYEGKCPEIAASIERGDVAPAA